MLATRLLALWLLVASAALGEEANSVSRPALLTGGETEFARRAFQITEIVLDKHVEPPTRQEMLLSGLTALLGDSVPEGLSRIVSSVAKEDEFVDCLTDSWTSASRPILSRQSGGDARRRLHQASSPSAE